MKYHFTEDEVQWVDHPRLKGAKSTTIFTKKDQQARGTINMVMLPKGGYLDWHDHGECDDILFIQSGNAKIELEGIGEFELKKGCHMLVPGPVKHRIHKIEEDLTMYTTKAPATH